MQRSYSMDSLTEAEPGDNSNCFIFSATDWSADIEEFVDNIDTSASTKEEMPAGTRT